MLKALGALLGYPSPELRAALPEIAAAIEAAASAASGKGSFLRPLRRTGALRDDDVVALRALVDELATGDPFSLEERYVDLFDRGRRTSLNLFEHVHGDSRDRGQAMVDLQAMYARGGLTLSAHELPDYLPAVLEYLSTRPVAEAREMLDDCAHIVRRIGEALADRGSRYAAVFAALLSIAGAKGLAGIDAQREPQPEEKPLDEEWAEEPVVFGPGAAPSCGAASAIGIRAGAGSGSGAASGRPTGA